MRVVVCEKPSQGRDVARNLGITSQGNGCMTDGKTVVTWAVGHLISLAEPSVYGEQFKQRGLEPLPILPGNNKWVVVPPPKDDRRSIQLNIIGSHLAKATSVLIATDADREGEMIGRELLEYFKYKGPVERLWLSSLDDKSIQAALNKILPGSQTESMYYAALGRSRADWLVGMNFSRAFTYSVGAASGHGNLSVGRVQTPTLAMVVAHDLHIENFIAKDYFTVTGAFKNDKGELNAEWKIPENDQEDGYCLKKSTAAKVVSDCDRQQGRVTIAQTTKKSSKAPLPLELSTLQQLCNKKWGFSGDDTLKIAQSLYETHKVTTYPRSDCRYLPTTQLSDVKDVLAAIGKVNPDLAPLVGNANPSIQSEAWNDKKITAHHAIIPNTNGNAGVYARMKDSEKKVYDLIASYYLAQFYADHEYNSTNIEIECGGHTFKVTGKVPTLEGWREVLGGSGESKSDDLPPFTVGDTVQCNKATLQSKKTKPPARMTEATLLGLMKNVSKQVDDKEAKKILSETLGIGTEATRSSIIKGLITKGFLKVVKKKELHSTPQARTLIGLLPEILTSPMMTAQWEQALLLIEKGTISLNDFMDKQYQFITGVVNEVKSGAYTKGIKAANPCPDCGSALMRRQRKDKKGYFWACMSYPECSTVLPDDNGKPGKKRPPPKLTDKDCPKCNGKLREVMSKNNNIFYSCQNYPDCKHSEFPVDPDTVTKIDCPKCKSEKLLKLKSKKGNPYLTCPASDCDYFGFPDDPKAKTGKPCPRCKEGELVNKTVKGGKSKGKTFRGCSGYPTCEYTEWDN